MRQTRNRNHSGCVGDTLLRKTSNCSNDSMKSNQNVPEIQGRLRISRHVQIEHVRSGFPRAWAAMHEALVVKLQLMMLFGHWMLEHCQPWPCLPASFENMSKCWHKVCWPKRWEAATLNPKLCHFKKRSVVKVWAKHQREEPHNPKP